MQRVIANKQKRERFIISSWLTDKSLDLQGESASWKARRADCVVTVQA